MRTLTPDEIRWLFSYAVGQLEPALRRDLASKNDIARRLAEQILVDRLLERFRGHEVLGPEPEGPPFG